MTALRDTLQLGLIGLTRIPLVAFVAPRVLQNDASAMRLAIPLGYRTRNHVGSMYFGVLATGADLACGLPVVRMAREQRQQVVPTLRDFHAEFLRRATGEVVFENQDVAATARAFDEAVGTGKRIELPVHVVARVPSDRPEEPVARFTATLSLKHRPAEREPFFRRVLARF